MTFFWGPRLFQYSAAVLAACALAFPMICAMFVYLSFGMGLLAWLAVMGIVFGAPIYLFAVQLIRKPSKEDLRTRTSNWHVWAVCLILHLGFSAGFCRASKFLPNAPNVKEGPFIQDFVQVVFTPVVIVYVLAKGGRSAEQAPDPTKVYPSR